MNHIAEPIAATLKRRTSCSHGQDSGLTQSTTRVSARAYNEGGTDKTRLVKKKKKSDLTFFVCFCLRYNIERIHGLDIQAFQFWGELS